MIFQAKPFIEGHVVIRDVITDEILVNKKNAINPENLSISIAQTLSNRAMGFIQSMVFGNGGSIVSGTGAVTYFPPNVTGQAATLYNQTFTKVVNDQSLLNTTPSADNLSVQHVVGNVFSDIIVTCLLDFNEPSGQEVFDDATTVDGAYVFDELGLVSFNPLTGGNLLTHVIFHPIQKSLNRQIEIIYTLRIYMS